MSDLLAIGASGASAYRTALEIVGENIVNAETPGYTRRQAVLRESSIPTGSGFLTFTRVQTGGVQPADTGRFWDEFRAADSRMTAAAAGRADARVRWLSAAESALDDGATGVGQSVARVYTSAASLAADPGNSFSRRAFLSAVDGAAAAFRTSADALSRLSSGVAQEVTTAIQAVNADAAALTRLNTAIRRSAPGSSSHAQLLDERDRLIDNISKVVEVDVTTANDGTATVEIARSGGQMLVAGAFPGELGLAQGTDGRLSITLFRDGALQPVSASSGQLAGLVEVAGNLADRRAQLNSMAADFATKLNDWHMAGQDQAGAAGTALFAFDPANAAATIAPAVMDRDPATVAAALAIDNGDGTFTTRANGNLLSLADGRAAAGTERDWSALVAHQSQILASSRAEQTTAAARRDGAFAARDEVSGIDLDYEAAELLRFQQAYNGSAKIIQVARETLQMIMEVL